MRPRINWGLHLVDVQPTHTVVVQIHHAVEALPELVAENLPEPGMKSSQKSGSQYETS